MRNRFALDGLDTGRAEAEFIDRNSEGHRDHADKSGDAANDKQQNRHVRYFFEASSAPSAGSLLTVYKIILIEYSFATHPDLLLLIEPTRRRA